jgi:phosphatidylethanolamine-binding protein (PEBP) family uncharacterized protein
MRRSFAARQLVSVLSAALMMLVAAACGSSGRDLREPNRNAVSPTRSTAAVTSSTFPPTSLQLVAGGFEPGAAIPAPNACGGTPPGLTWTGVPADTMELAVGLVDFDETDMTKRVHWLVAGLPAPAAGTSEGTLPAGAALPPGAVTLNNGKGTATYDGPCPTAGTPHTLNYMVFALPAASGLAAGAAPAESFTMLEGLAQGNIAYYTGTVGA